MSQILDSLCDFGGSHTWARKSIVAGQSSLQKLVSEHA